MVVVSDHAGDLALLGKLTPEAARQVQSAAITQNIRIIEQRLTAKRQMLLRVEPAKRARLQQEIMQDEQLRGELLRQQQRLRGGFQP
jgi:hypothetical protein